MNECTGDNYDQKCNCAVSNKVCSGGNLGEKK